MISGSICIKEKLYEEKCIKTIYQVIKEGNCFMKKYFSKTHDNKKVGNTQSFKKLIEIKVKRNLAFLIYSEKINKFFIYYLLLLLLFINHKSLHVFSYHTHIKIQKIQIIHLHKYKNIISFGLYLIREIVVKNYKHIPLKILFKQIPKIVGQKRKDHAIKGLIPKEILRSQNLAEMHKQT
jgi:hypothetical protein